MRIVNDKHMTSYQKSAQKKLQKFKNAYDKTPIKEHVPVQDGSFLDEAQIVENSEIQETRNQLEGDNNYTSQNSNNQENVSKSNKRRGPTICKGIRTESGEKLVVSFNEKGQPIGRNSELYSSYLGKISRERAPISYPTWHKVLLGIKDKMWTAIKQKFIVPEAARKLTLKLIGKNWRGYKVRLRKAHIYAHECYEDRINDCPTNVKLEDWKAFIAYVSKEEFKNLRQKGKEAVQHNTLPHTSSRKGYARTEDDLRHTNVSDVPVTRGAVWSKAHRHKNGEPVNEIAKEKIERIKEIDSTVTYGQDDALANVLGPDPNGRVRGVGYGVTASTLFGVHQCVGKMDNLETRCEKLEAEVLSLRKVVANMNKESNHLSQPSNEDPREQSNSLVQRNQNVNLEGIASKVVRCKLFRLVPEDVVAEGYWYTDDPNALLHHQPLGLGFSKVAVEVAKQKDALLVRNNNDMRTIEDAVGSFVAWPTNSIIKE